MPECLNKMTMPGFSVYRGMRYGYNNIVTYFAILEFLFARCVHPGAPLPFYLFSTRVRARITKASKIVINFSS